MNKEKKRIKNLISFVKAHPSLYDVKSNLYNCKKRKQIIWNQFENDGNRTKASWANLLSNYRRERKNLEFRNRGNPIERYEPIYSYYSQLNEFLHNVFNINNSFKQPTNDTLMDDDQSTSSSDRETDFDGELIDLTSDTENENKSIHNKSIHNEQAPLNSLNKSSKAYQTELLKLNDQASSSKICQPTKFKNTKIHQNQSFKTNQSQFDSTNQISLSFKTSTKQNQSQFNSSNQILSKKEIKLPNKNVIQQNRSSNDNFIQQNRLSNDNFSQQNSSLNDNFAQRNRLSNDNFIRQNSADSEDVKPKLNNVKSEEGLYDFNILAFQDQLLNRTNEEDHITNFSKSLIPQLRTIFESNSIEYEKLKISISKAIIKSLETCKNK